jgi:hypothetical protein
MADTLRIKAHVDTLDEVPGPWRLGYVQGEDGKFHLQVDGVPLGFAPKEKVDEYRDNNRALNQSKTDLEATVAAVTGERDKYAADLAAVVAERDVLKSRPDATTQVTALEQQLVSEKAAHDATRFKALVGGELLRAGGRVEAVDFLIEQARKTFTMGADGQLTTTQFSATHPGVLLPLSEWIAGQMTASAFAFKPSRGGGATGRNGDPPAKPFVDKNDPLAVGRNLQNIVDGTVDVR